jgi:hypothetical protein
MLIDLVHGPIHSPAVEGGELVVLVAGRVSGVWVSHRYPYRPQSVWIYLLFSRLYVFSGRVSVICVLPK